MALGMPLPVGQLPPAEEQRLCWSFPACPHQGVSPAIALPPLVLISQQGMAGAAGDRCSALRLRHTTHAPALTTGS